MYDDSDGHNVELHRAGRQCSALDYAWQLRTAGFVVVTAGED